MRRASIAFAVILLAGCSRGSAQVQPPVDYSPPTLTFPSPEPSSTPTPSHVFVIVLENRSYAQVVGNGYIAQLAQKYAYTANYHGVSHPSLPNYLALTSGTTYGITDDGWHNLPAGGLGAQLTAAGVDWRAYMEGMSNGCYHSPYPYALKHNPFAYYGGTCPSEVVPFTRFANDMQARVPRFVWITPDLCHDGHDCSNSTVDAWLSQTVPTILDSSAWQDNGVLFITWDEGEDSANSVLTLVIHPDPRLHRSDKIYNHYSLLATIEDDLGVPRLGGAAQAAPIDDLLATQPLPRSRQKT
ncbi:MAG TPA: alkaline phosphatase family protein [Candidatus Dormibacteraeota bacterium]|nr:alkaline phosphatase family protein [Candidatus Dormibacteraeota bacterium]